MCVAESDAAKGYGPGFDEGTGMSDADFERYSNLVKIVRQDLDSLEYNIYYTWMLEVKKRLHKMIIPALIESQSLPGFVTTEGQGRMFSRMLQGMQGTQQPTATMDDVLDLLNKVYKCLKSFYMEESVMQQVVTELLKLIGQIAFNDLIMRRNFCSWKRGESSLHRNVTIADTCLAMQIQYNITRIEGNSRYHMPWKRMKADHAEWCKSHDMPEGLLQLEHLMQATKLLQLKKACCRYSNMTV